MLEHTLNIGLNDMVIRKQEIETDRAIEIIGAVLGDCTVKQGATGFYAHEDGSKVVEKSLEVVVYGGRQKQVIAKVRELKVLLNQESIVYNCEQSKAKFI